MAQEFLTPMVRRNTNTNKKRNSAERNDTMKQIIRVRSIVISIIEAEMNEAKGSQQAQVLKTLLDAKRSRGGGRSYLLTMTNKREVAAVKRALQAADEYDVTGATTAHVARLLDSIAS